MVSPPEREARPAHQTSDRLAGAGIFLFSLGLYLATLAPTVLEADGGEFQFVPWLPGIAHPTGYPLYLLLGWLWTHLLPIGEVAWRMNLLSAVLGALAVGLTYGVARQMVDMTLPDTPFPARVIAAAIAALVFAMSHAFWSQAIIAEVYALHALFVVLLLGLALRYRRLMGAANRNDRLGKLFAFTIGLSLTHHRAIVLLLPALALFLAATHRTQSPPEKSGAGRLWLNRALFLLAPLLLYLYLPLVAPITPYTQLHLSDTQTLTLYDNSLTGFWQHVLGTVFSAELQPTAAGLDRLGLTWQLLRQQVGWVGALLALPGLITLWQRQLPLLILTGVGFVAFLGFNLIYFIGDVFVLFIPNWLFVALWLGVGSLGLADSLSRNLVRRKTGSVNSTPGFEALEQRLGQRIYRFSTISLTALALSLPLVLLVTRYPEVNQANNTATRERWQAILAEPIPAEAILLSNDRNEIMPLWYYQYVEARRPDLLGLFPRITPDPAFTNVGQTLAQALASGRPVYLIKAMAGLEIKAQLTPVGTLWQATPYLTSPAYPLNHSLSQISLVGYDLSSTQVSPGKPITVTLHWQVAQPLERDYTSYVHLVNSAGQGVAQSDQRPGGDFYPSRYWQPGESLRDRHALTVPGATPPGEYMLRVGLYHQPQPGVIESMGQGLEIGSLTIK